MFNTIRKESDSSEFLNIGVPLLWLFGFLGFKLFLAVTVATGNSSTAFSIVYRGAFLACCLTVVFMQSIRTLPKIPAGFLGLVAVFFFFYFCRIFYDGLILEEVSFFDYSAKAVGGAFIPMIAFLFPMGKIQRQRAFWGLYWLGLTTVFVMFYFYRDLLGGSYRGARYHSDVDVDLLITPHALSYMGGGVCCLASWALITESEKIRKVTKSILLVSLIPAGGLVVFGGSKGAAVSFLLVFVSIIVSKRSIRMRTIVITAVVVLVSGFGFASLNSEDMGGFSARFLKFVEEVSSGDSDAGSGRVDIWLHTLQQYGENIVCGSGIVERETLSHPHNHILESFMATGLLGGVCFVAVNAIGILSAWRLLRRDSGCGWIAALYLFFFIQGLISSPLIKMELWLSLAAVVSADRATRKRSKCNMSPGRLRRLSRQARSKAEEVS